MSDQFLKDYRREPRREFADRLRLRIADKGLFNRIEEMDGIEQRTGGAWRGRRGAGRLAFGGLALMLALVIALAASPAVRAQVQEVFREVGGLLFNETERYPGKPDSQVTIVPSQTLTLAEARQQLPFEIVLPAWLPEGYTAPDTVRVTHFNESSVIHAEVFFLTPQAGGQYLHLNIMHQANGEAMKQIIGTDSAETVTVNGREAALVRGAWNRDKQRWDNPEQIALYWQQHGVTYGLETIEPALSVDDLVRIAESVP